MIIRKLCNMNNKVFITKSLLFISLMLLVIISVNAQTISDNNPDFTLTTNGTCICTDASIGESGTFFTGTANEVTYTKRSKLKSIHLINANQTNPEIALTCTSGITDMSFFFNQRTLIKIFHLGMCLV